MPPQAHTEDDDPPEEAQPDTPDVSDQADEAAEAAEAAEEKPVPGTYDDGLFEPL